MAATTYAKGYTLTIDGVTIGRMHDNGIPDPSPEAEKVDDTDQDSGDYYDFFLGRINSGTANLQCTFDADDAGQAAIIAAYAADIVPGALPHLFVLTLPNGIGKKSYYAYVSTATTPIVDKKVTLKATLIITGGSTWSGTTTALTTPFFVVTGTPGGALTAIVPANSATIGTYIVYAATTVESVTVTPTCATTGAVITVDGTVVATGAASASKALTAGAVRTILVKVTKAGEVPGLYRLLVGRAAS